MATETKPRGPIAAEYSSPGPAYGLPRLVGAKEHDPRSTKQRGPAYSFGTRHAAFTTDSSPGPCYYPDPKFGNKGADGAPKYSIYSRSKDSTLDKIRARVSTTLPRVCIKSIRPVRAWRSAADTTSATRT